MRITGAVLLTLIAVPLFGELRRGIIDEIISADVQVQSNGDDTVIMAVDTRTSGRPDGVVDFVLRVRAESSFDERFAYRIENASVMIRANRAMVFAPDRKLAIVFEHDANCADCDYGRSRVLRYPGFEIVRIDGDRNRPHVAAEVCQAGGIGSTSCGVGGCSNGTASGCSATCGSGHYSCCNCTAGGSNCGCCKE